MSGPLFYSEKFKITHSRKFSKRFILKILQIKYDKRKIDLSKTSRTLRIIYKIRQVESPFRGNIEYSLNISERVSNTDPVRY